MVSLLAVPGTSVKVPKFEVLLVTAATVAVPVLNMLPLARGVPAVGRTRTFCQVSEQVTPLALAAVIVKVICEELIEVMATAVPLLTSLMLLLPLPLPVSRVIKTVGAVPPVSNLNPAGALRMIVPAPASPLAAS